LIAGFSGYRWGLKSQIYARNLEAKAELMPLIEKFKVGAGGRENWFSLRPDSIEAICDTAIKLKSLLTGSKRRLLIEAWEGFSGITPKDFYVFQPNEEAEKTNKSRQMFLTGLDALRKAVENC
jgi:hypothetical protein